jgi:hypothetical protein
VSSKYCTFTCSGLQSQSAKNGKTNITMPIWKKNPNFWTEHVYGSEPVTIESSSDISCSWCCACQWPPSRRPRRRQHATTNGWRQRWIGWPARRWRRRRQCLEELKAAAHTVYYRRGRGVTRTTAARSSGWAAIRARGVGVRKRMWHRRMLDGIYFHYRKPLDLRWNLKWASRQRI